MIYLYLAIFVCLLSMFLYFRSQRVFFLYNVPIFAAVYLMGVAGLFLSANGYYDGRYFINAINQDQLFIDSMLILLVGFALSFFASIFSFSLTKPRRVSSVDISHIAPLTNLQLFVMFLIVILASIYYLWSVNPSPLYVTLFEDSYSGYQRRLEVTRNYQGISYVSTVARYYVPCATYVMYFNYQASKSKISRNIFFLSSALCLLVLVSNAEKATFIIWLIGFILASALLAPKFFSAGLFIKLAASISGLLVFSYFLFSNGNILETIDSILYRIFVGPTISIPLTLQYLDENGFYGYSSIQSSFLRAMLFIDEYKPPLSELFVQIYFPGMQSNGGWNVNGFFFGEAFGWHGWFGVVSGSIYYGIFNGAFVGMILRFRSSPLVLGCYIFTALSVTGILTSFSLVIFSTHLILVYLIIGFIAQLRGNLCFRR